MISKVMDKLEDTLLLLVVHFGLMLAASAGLDCSSETEMLKLQERCFTDQGITVSLPTYVEGSKLSHKKTYMEAVIAQKADLLCAQQAEFEAGLQCAMNHTRSCMPLDYQGYVPEPSKMSKLVSILCSQEVDFECFKTKASDLYDCGVRKGQKVFSKEGLPLTTENIMCKAFQFNAECQVVELRDCGCKTVRAYQTVSLDQLYPPACPPLLEQPRVQCHSDNQLLFSDNAGSGVCEHVALSLFLSFVFIWFELLV